LDRLETKFANLQTHLRPRDLLGALKDLGGIPSGGNHLQEVSEAARGLSRLISTLRNVLRHPQLGDSDRARADQLLQQATAKLQQVKEVIGDQ
jgi:hypothetical protein